MSSLVQRMRERTAQLHAAAEKSGAVAALLTGQLSRTGYMVYLRNLLPAYHAMEHALHRHRHRAELAELALPALYRADSIIADLDRLAGPRWAVSLPLLPVALDYARRVERAGRSPLLIAHCYTRYLGDLNGGQLLARRLLRIFGPDCPAFAFTAFPAIADLHGFAQTYRAALDRAGSHAADPQAVVDEAAVAFQINIDLSQAVQPSLTQSQ